MGYKGDGDRTTNFKAKEATFKRLEESKCKKQKEQQANGVQITSCLDSDEYEDGLES